FTGSPRARKAVGPRGRIRVHAIGRARGVTISSAEGDGVRIRRLYGVADAPADRVDRGESLRATEAVYPDAVGIVVDRHIDRPAPGPRHDAAAGAVEAMEDASSPVETVRTALRGATKIDRWTGYYEPARRQKRTKASKRPPT